MNQLKQINTKLDVITESLEPQSEPISHVQVPVFPPRARRFDPDLSRRIDRLIALEENAETPSERAFWRNLREQESNKIYDKFDVGGKYANQRVSSAF